MRFGGLIKVKFCQSLPSNSLLIENQRMSNKSLMLCQKVVNYRARRRSANQEQVNTTLTPFIIIQLAPCISDLKRLRDSYFFVAQTCSKTHLIFFRRSFKKNSLHFFGKPFALFVGDSSVCMKIGLISNKDNGYTEKKTRLKKSHAYANKTLIFPRLYITF